MFKNFFSNPLEINLPNSKSIENRLLLMGYLSGKPIPEITPEDCNDVQVFKRNLKILKTNSSSIINVDDCGFAWRCFMVLLSVLPGKRTLTGKTELQKRPVAELVSALTEIGADISENHGNFVIQGNPDILSRKVSCNAEKTGQNISALRLCGFQQVEVLGIPASPDYIQMTEFLLKNPETVPEKDWSAAAFWFIFAALNPNHSIFLKGLSASHLQPDQKIIEISVMFGVKSSIFEKGISICGNSEITDHFVYDFTNCIDLAPIVITCCALLNINAEFSGLNTLRYKESNRLQALQVELSKFADIQIVKNNIVLKPSSLNYNRHLSFKTYNDHRLAMSFLLTQMRFEKVILDDTDCIRKSYPQLVNYLFR